MLDPLKLRVLRSVAETGSIRASAEALGYTPSAVSQHLTGLRRETGVTLLERSGRGIAVTPAGRELARAAGTALDALDEVSRVAGELRAGRTGTLTLSYATSVASTWIPWIAQRVRDTFPDLGLNLMLQECSMEDPDTRGDVIITGGTESSFGEDWISVPLLEEGYVALVGAEHELASRESVTMQDLRDHPWVTDDPLNSWWFDRIAAACRAAGYSPPVRVNPTDFNAVVGFVATGSLISVQPSLGCQDLGGAVRAVPIDVPALRRQVDVQMRRTVAGHPAAQFIVEQAREIAARKHEQIPGVELL